MPPQPPSPLAPRQPAPHQPSAPCPCGSSKSLANCCLPYIQGLQKAPTAESLMRSRYTAHVVQAIDYLWETWDKAQRRRSSREDVRAWAATCEWLGLEIIATDKGGDADSQGLVSFIAHFRQDGQTREHREISLFKRTSGHWVYVDHA
jgi:SEC-C motif-containing protein